MLKLLLSPPLLYLLLCDGKRGPNFMVAIVRLIADNSAELAHTLHLGLVDWPSTISLTDQQTAFLLLLELDVESAIHWFQQLGLADGHAQDDMKRLVKRAMNWSSTSRTSKQNTQSCLACWSARSVVCRQQHGSRNKRMVSSAPTISCQ
jgi:hypothetical protein